VGNLLKINISDKDRVYYKNLKQISAQRIQELIGNNFEIVRLRELNKRVYEMCCLYLGDS